MAKAPASAAAAIDARKAVLEANGHSTLRSKGGYGRAAPLHCTTAHAAGHRNAKTDIA